MMSFEIIPFPLLPAHIRWWTGKFNNQEYGDILFETVDDVDACPDFDFMFGVVWSDGQFGVYADYNDALWALIDERDEQERQGEIWRTLFSINRLNLLQKQVINEVNEHQHFIASWRTFSFRERCRIEKKRDRGLAIR